MDNFGNNTILSKNRNPIQSIKLIIYEKKYFKDLVNTSTMAIEDCMKTFFLNDTIQKGAPELIFNYNGTNIECLPHAPVLTKSGKVRACVLFVITLLSFIGNVTTIISLRSGTKSKGRARPSWTAIYSLIFQLSIADLLVTVFCLAGDAAWSLTVEWYGGNIGCKVFKYVQMFALYLSTFVLVLIGIDRWLAVKFPMRSMNTAKRSRMLVIIVWVLSCLLSIPQVIIFGKVKGPFVEDFYQCATHGFYTETWQELTYTTITFLFMFIIPLLILISTYVSTVRTIAKSQKLFQPEGRLHIKNIDKDLLHNVSRNNNLNRAKMKSLRMSVVIVAAFLIWWTPYYVMMMIFMFWSPDKELTEALQNGIFFFGMSNSLVNPVIYGAFHLWPKKKSYRLNGRESMALQASFLPRGDLNTSSARLRVRSTTKS